MFLSIQGEGKRAAPFLFFIRTNHCNLRCKFNDNNLCDTPYTSWSPDDTANIGLTPIEKIITEYSKNKSKDVVITGGEPAMYPEEVNDIMSRIEENTTRCLSYN